MPGQLLQYLPIAGSFLQQGIDWLTGRSNIDRQTAANRRLMQWQHDRNWDLLQDERAYSSPEAQMARLKKAGLNPNLVYGSGGSASGGTPTSKPTGAIPTDVTMPSPVNLPAMIGAYQDFQLKKAQTDQIRASEAMTRAKTVTEAARNVDLIARGKKAGFEASKAEALSKYDYTFAQHAYRKSVQQLQKGALDVSLGYQKRDANLPALEAELKRRTFGKIDAEAENIRLRNIYQRYENQWRSMGFTSHDNVAFRVLVRMLSEQGLVPTDLF